MSMPFVYPHISIIALLAGALVQFVIGFVWYAGMTPIGRRWAAEVGAPTDGQPGAEMLVFPFSSILAAWAVGMVYGWSSASGPMDGVLVGWVVATAVGAQVLSTAIATNQRSTALLAINIGYLVVSYGVMGAVFGLLS